MPPHSKDRKKSLHLVPRPPKVGHIDPHQHNPFSLPRRSSMSRPLNRRKFLQASAFSAGAAGFYLTGGVTETRAQESANNRLNIAVIGCGGQGAGNLSNVIGPPTAPRENLVAMCDVDDNTARGHFNTYPNVPKFKDFRVMLDRVRNIDAV